MYEETRFTNDQCLCPVCRQNTMAQKVSALFLNNASTSIGLHIQTCLGQYLSPPEPQVARFYRTRLWIKFILLALGLLVLFAGCALANNYPYHFSPESLWYQYLFLIVGLASSFASLWGIYWLLLKTVFSKARARGEEEQNRLNERYRTAYALWQQLYYCHRCGVVFLPGQSKVIPPDQLSAVIMESVSLSATDRPGDQL
jgi:hypothetical protein